MKKTLRFSLLSILLLVCGMVKAETATFDFTGTEAYGMTLLSGSTGDYNANPTICTEGVVTMTLTGNKTSRWWKASSGNELRFYTGSSMTFTVPEGNVITKIVLNAMKKTDWKSSVGTYADGIWTGNLASVVIETTITKSNTAIYGVEVTYQSSSAPVKKDPKLAFDATTATVELGQAFTAPTLTKETTADVAYTSSNTEVATVDAATGALTIHAAGETTITASVEENEEFAAGHASYKLTVTAPAMSEVKLPYTETFATGIGSFTIDNVNLPEGLTYIWTHDSKNSYMKASAYKNQNYASESWLVSPKIDLATAKAPTLKFTQCISKYFGTVAEEATLMILDKDGMQEKIDITYPTIESGNWSKFEEQEVDLSAYAGQKINVIFKYTSTDSAAGTWEIKNVSVFDNAGTAIKGITTNDANEKVIFNLAGQRLNKVQKGINIINGKKVIVK